MSDEGALAEQEKLASIRNLKAAAIKSLCEARNVRQQYIESKKPKPLFDRFSGAQTTIVLAIFAFIFQVLQYRWTNRDATEAQETTQWKEAVKQV